MRYLNKCFRCHRRVQEVKSKMIDGKQRWLCYDCHEKEVKNK